MRDVFVVGAFSTAFGRFPDKSYKELTRETYLGVLGDAGLADGAGIGMAWFSNCGMWIDGQACIRGQVCFTPLVRDKLFPERVPMANVEGGCASGQIALNGAWKDILSGQAEMSLAIGVEKLYNPSDPEKTMTAYQAGIDNFDPEDWQAYYRAAGERAGAGFEPGPNRTVFMDTYAMQAAYHMKKYGTTQRQLAIAAAKNHTNGSRNPKSQYKFQLTPEAVLEDRLVAWPLTRAMCAPVGDGGAAILLCSKEKLAELPAAARERAVALKASVLTGGKYRDLDEAGLSFAAANKAYAMAGVEAADIDVAEVHDATAFSEIYQAEMLGFCGEGEGGKLVESGATAIGGRIPINTSGGLVSKGHPVGATGLSMIAELTTQLRGEAGPRQVKGATLALAENAGGVTGFDEAACSVCILEKPGG